MSLITDEMIESLREPSGFSRFSLYLLGAISATHTGLLPAEFVWRPKVLCSKISRRQLHTIRHHAKLLARRHAPPESDQAMRLRLLSRFLKIWDVMSKDPAFTNILRIINEELKPDGQTQTTGTNRKH